MRGNSRAGPGTITSDAGLFDHPPRRRRGLCPEAPDLSARARRVPSRVGAGRRRGALAFRARRRSTSSCWTSCCRSSTGSRSASGCARRARCRSSCSRRATTSSTRSSASSWARTTTSRSRSRSASSAAVSVRCCAEPARLGVTLPKPSRSVGRAPARSRPPRGGVDGRSLELTYVEFELLRTLVAQPGKVFSRRALLQAIWGDSSYREPRTIDVHVRHLREKVDRIRSEPELILTVRGAGYRLREHETPADRRRAARLGAAGRRRGRARVRLPDRDAVARGPARRLAAGSGRRIADEVAQRWPPPPSLTRISSPPVTRQPRTRA